MSKTIGYGVVMVQDESEHEIFYSENIEDCRFFAKREASIFEKFVLAGFPQENVPSYFVVAYGADQSTNLVIE